MMADLERVRRDYAPTVAFLPVSRMTYAYAHGGVNGLCRKISTGLLDQSFQYTPGLRTQRIGPDRSMRVASCLTRLLRSMRQPRHPKSAIFSDKWPPGLGDRVMALRPQDSLELDDFKQNWQRNVRRTYLFTWLRSVAVFNSLDHGLSKFVVYRGPRRLWRGTRSAASHHHH